MQKKNYILFENYNIDIIIDNTNKIWFNSRQLAKAIGYIDKKNAIKTHTDINDRVQLKNISHSINFNRHPQTVYLSEAGMYKLILRSKMDNSKKFVDWITDEVLPATQVNEVINKKTALPNEIDV
jgi:prophage antirepressor-like protein